MMCVMSLFPSVWLAAFVSPGRLLVRLRVGILKFAHPCARGDFCSAELCCRSSVAKRGSSPCPVPCSSPGTERACSCPSPKGWYRASRTRRLGLSRAFFVGPCGYCSVDSVTWGVGFNRGGGLCLPWMWMMCGVSMFPSVRLAAVVSPGWLLMCLRVGMVRFSRPCARGGFCDASGAKAGFLPGRCCAASLCSISCWY